MQILLFIPFFGHSCLSSSVPLNVAVLLPAIAKCCETCLRRICRGWVHSFIVSIITGLMEYKKNKCTSFSYDPIRKWEHVFSSLWNEAGSKVSQISYFAEKELGIWASHRSQCHRGSVSPSAHRHMPGFAGPFRGWTLPWGKAEVGFHRLERTQLRHQPPPSYLSILVLLVTGSHCYLGLGRKARYCATLRPSFLCRPICTHINAYQLYNSNCRCILIHALNFLFLPYVAIIRVFTVKSSSKEMGGGFVTHLPLFRWTRCPSVQNQSHGFSLRVCSKLCVQIRKESLELWGRHVSATCLDRAQNKYQWFFRIPPGMISVLAS